MKYNYNYKGKMINVFVSDNSGDNEVAITFDGRSYDGILQTDSKGRFFIFKKNKIYLSDLLPFNFERLNEKIEKMQYITPLEFLQATRSINSIEVDYPYAKKEENKTYTMHNNGWQRWDDEYSVISVKKEKGKEPVVFKLDMNSYDLSFMLNMRLMNFVAGSAF